MSNDAMPITIPGYSGPVTFHPIRESGPWAIGWARAEMPEDGGFLRFPAMVSVRFDKVATAADWQAPWEQEGYAPDLADPASVAEMVSTGQGRMVWPATGNPVSADIVARFTDQRA